MLRFARLLATAVPLCFCGADAQADVTISTAATQSMNCSDGTCVPTATKAVLNAGDLENYLSQFGDVRVMTTGNGVEANNLVVNAAFASPDSTSLTLDAKGAITVNAAVSIGSGTAELELQSGALSFGRKGNITFGSLSDIFGINGGIFTLVGSVQGLASAVAANPSGAFALANSYDASQDGTYSSSPIATNFKGTLEGVGNTISNLTINFDEKSDIGLFASITGTIEDVRLAQVSILDSRRASRSNVGGLTGFSEGALLNDSVTGIIQTGGSRSSVGGLVGQNLGIVGDCYSGADVTVDDESFAGGLVGLNEHAGSEHFGQISNSYATGSVAAATRPFLGGLLGYNGCEGGCGAVQASYSTGAVSAAHVLDVGGFVGFDGSSGGISNSYWDTSTSGITNLGQGAGEPPNDPGITGLTTQQLQSGLPTGFDPKIWTEKSGINNGLPYLIANPPPE